MLLRTAGHQFQVSAQQSRPRPLNNELVGAICRGPDLFGVFTSILRVFIGSDPRQSVAVQVLAHSIWKKASKPVSITPLVLGQLPLKRVGLTEFTYTRYLPPYLCNYHGHAIFLDADMLVMGDIYELADLADKQCGVSVVKNKMRFEWPSLMVFNNHLCKRLTPELIELGQPQSLDWSDGGIGDLPKEWNHCVGYDEPNPKTKLAHYTQGIPCFPETQDCEFSEEWVNEARASMSTVTWPEIMGTSVHAKPVLERLQKRSLSQAGTKSVPSPQ